MVSADTNFNGSRDLTTPLSGLVCHTLVSTCYDQPIYQIWSLYLHPPRRYDMRFTMSKLGCLW